MVMTHWYSKVRQSTGKNEDPYQGMCLNLSGLTGVGTDGTANLNTLRVREGKAVFQQFYKYIWSWKLPYHPYREGLKDCEQAAYNGTATQFEAYFAVPCRTGGGPR